MRVEIKYDGIQEVYELPQWRYIEFRRWLLEHGKEIEVKVKEPAHD